MTFVIWPELGKKLNGHVSKTQVWKMEPSAENILYHIQKIIEPLLPQELKLVHMKIYETKDSFAEWFAD